VSELLLRRGDWSDVDPASAGWRYLSFRVETMRAGDERQADSGAQELALVPLAGSCTVQTDEGEWEVGGRADVFSGLPRSLYVPRDTTFTLRAAGDAEIAVCGARAEQRREPRPIPPEEVEIEVRGAGNATRQINHIVKPEFPAERLLVVEVYTPSGNWSSYPPHKHDEDHGDSEAVLEETYYFRTRTEPSGAFAVQRLYSPTHGLDLTETVRDGDLLLVPWGYHTTCAAHGHDLYYLNALAGDRRTMAAADDPDLAWIRPAWAELEQDPRVPLVL
jgi:5-deoxy-glucuronate isomerase